MSAVSAGITVPEQIVDQVEGFEFGPDIVIEPKQIEAGPTKP